MINVCRYLGAEEKVVVDSVTYFADATGLFSLFFVEVGLVKMMGWYACRLRHHRPRTAKDFRCL